MSKDSGDTSSLLPFDLDKKLKHYVQTLSANIHHFYLYGIIEDDISMYSDMLNVLRSANENDTVVVYINSEGGTLRMALQIANAMLSTPAKVITSLDGDAISAATFIFLAGEEYIINPNCSFMIHNYSGFVHGKGHELVSQINHTGATVSKMMRFFYEKLLTEEELNDVCNGKDLWMDSDELMKRLSTIKEEDIVEEKEDLLDAEVATNQTPKKIKKKKVRKKVASKGKSKPTQNTGD